MWKIRGEEMEENMFHDFLIEYENICQELTQLNFIDRSIEISKLEQIIQRQEQFIQYCKETADRTCETEKEKSRLLEKQTGFSIKLIAEAKKRREVIKERQEKKRQKRQELEMRLKIIKERAKKEKEKQLEKKRKTTLKKYLYQLYGKGSKDRRKIRRL